MMNRFVQSAQETPSPARSEIVHSAEKEEKSE